MKKIKITKHFLKKITLPTIIFVQFALIAVLACYIHWAKINIDFQNDSAPMKISQLILKAIEALNLPVPTDAKTGRIYFYEAKITLPPASDPAQRLYYFYSPPDKYGGTEMLGLKDKLSVDMQKSKVYAASTLENVFKEVPKLQACSRGYEVFFTQPGKFGADGKLLFTKKLNDGRTARIYLDPECTDNQDLMVPYLKQMQSY
jgi:hypothetical protein